MFRPVKADIALIGGVDIERSTIAIKLRQIGYSVHAEFTTRKRSKMYSAAKAESHLVIDLSDKSNWPRLLALNF